VQIISSSKLFNVLELFYCNGNGIVRCTSGCAISFYYTCYYLSISKKGNCKRIRKLEEKITEKYPDDRDAYPVSKSEQLEKINNLRE
jgi:isocitrate lyase